MLILRGDDRYGTHRQVTIAQELCRCPVEVLFMADCGPHREKLDQTLDAIAHFVERVLPARLAATSQSGVRRRAAALDVAFMERDWKF